MTPADNSSTAIEPRAAGTAIGRTIGIAAIIVMLGNLGTSILGFVRQTVVVDVFPHHATDAFFAASLVPQMFYDLTIGAAISAALIPTFTEIAERRGRRALGETVGVVLGLVWCVLGVLVVLLVLGAQPLMTVILWSNHVHPRPGAFADSVRIARILVISLFFLGTSAVLLSTLYSLRRFTAPAFATAFYHLGIIAGALLLTRPFGILALPIGAVGGAAAQAAVQAPALWRAGLRPRLRVRLTPETRTIARLYGPVALGLLVSIAGQILDINFKWQLGETTVTAMALATTLTQFPIGIAVAALTFAILPSISSDASFGRTEQFKDTLVHGIRLVLFLTVPAALGYLLLATPIVQMLAQRGQFDAHASHLTVLALIGYSFQIPFVGIDQLLIFSFYARKNTVTPMLIGVLGVGIYAGSALLLMPTLKILGLALANTLQNSLHGLILLGILIATTGSLGGRGMVRSIVKTAIAGTAMALAAGLAVRVLGAAGGHGAAHRLLLGLAPLLFAAVAYIATAAAVRSEELRSFTSLIRARLG